MSRLARHVSVVMAMSSLALVSLRAQTDVRQGVVGVTVHVELTCPSCAQGLERRLNRLDHVSTVSVRAAAGEIEVHVAPGGSLDVVAIRDTVRNAGFLPDALRVTAIGDVTVDDSGAASLSIGDDDRWGLVSADSGAALADAAEHLVQVTGVVREMPNGDTTLEVSALRRLP